MKHSILIATLLAAMVVAGRAQVPDNLVAESVPVPTAELKAEAGRYLEFRAAAFNGWHPTKRELLITTRFADAVQLHEVRMPGGARRQLTFTPEPVGGGHWQPKHGRYIVFSQDKGGGEFYQLFRLDPDTGRITLLTDGKSRNSGARFTRSGSQIAYTSTRRNGRDTDIYVMNPAEPKTDRSLCELSGGGWSPSDWSEDESKLLLNELISANKSRLWLLDVKSGTKELLTPDEKESVAYGAAQFARDGKTIYFTSDKGSEFLQLVQMDLKTRAVRALSGNIAWNVDEFELSPDGKTIAFITNEDGVGKLHLIDARSGKGLNGPKLPMGIPGGVAWHENGREIAFNFTSARSPADVYSFDLKSGKVERWTESETGGMPVTNFIEPELIKLKSFDGLQVSGFLYRPDPKKFPGKRPVIVNIHGGPESQSRPIFQSRNNYYLNELGIAIFYPNVRGSEGYGKTFLALDNGFKREDSVRDIAAFLDFTAQDKALDADRIAVVGGSYGGYMSLACLTHYSDRLRCGIDVVGISNFLTFLKNTQDYRRDLRRVEYGDERDPAMAEFLQHISPLTNVEKIRKPLFVVQGLNDPRVPVTEAEQVVKAVRDRGGVAWYLMAKDEGHGFQKKKNADFMFLSMITFFRANLLN
ncbi:MAG: peptidase prolyl oligopeptidase active site domain protein [Verrucomicrobiota bacterium]|jgi:dipeptidyl aminopeptidase/acylaminoacyl peptidase